MTAALTATVPVTARVAAAKSGAERLFVKTPFHPSFAGRAKSIGGLWSAEQKHWSFDPRDSDRVAALCRDLFGTDWTPVSQGQRTVTVRLTIPSRDADGNVPNWARLDSWAELFDLGRCLLARPGRDAAVGLGRGVVLLSGKMDGNRGSANYPSIGVPSAPSVLEIRDVPEALLDAAREKFGDALEIVPDAPQPATLPRPTVNLPSSPADPRENPTVSGILAAFRGLQATEQARVLALLQEELPS